MSVTGMVTLLISFFLMVGAARVQAQTTTIRAIVGEVQTDRHVIVAVEVAFLGVENSLGGSLNYDPTELNYLGFSNSSTYPGSVFFLNTLGQAAGRIGFLYGMPGGRVFPAGVGKILTFEFAVLKPGRLSLNFTDIPVIREVVNVRAIPIPSDFQGGVIETPLPSIGLFYTGPTRGFGPAYVLLAGFAGADKGVVVAFTDYQTAGQGGEVVGEIFPGEAKRLEYPARPGGVTYFRIFPMLNGNRWGDIPWTTAVLR